MSLAMHDPKSIENLDEEEKPARRVPDGSLDPFKRLTGVNGADPED